MAIPDWFDWIFLGLAFLQVYALIPIIRRVRGLDLEVRSKARFDLTETIGSIMVFCGMPLSQRISGSWFWLALAGFALMGAGYTVKGLRLLRVRRRPTA
ncbi:hypothetical protein OG458_07205 [Streptomyces sp. NBC_01281]|uniref:hypothetical protein n=1 Tax=Streptomyces sp. NBC_01281 TaxID=2903811 RepID=UPI002E11F71D|nr:hypothetical protein OG458_07205 [Streptomyces sp. NBC_01281]